MTNELNSKNHESLKVLSKNANTDDIHRFTRFAQSFTETGDKEKADAVLQVSVAANRKNYDKVRRTSDMCEALRELMKEEIEEELKKSRDKAIQEDSHKDLNRDLNRVLSKVLSRDFSRVLSKVLSRDASTS